MDPQLKPRGGPSSYKTGPQKLFQVIQNCEASSSKTGPQFKPRGPSSSKTGPQFKPRGPSSSKDSQLKAFQITQNCRPSSSKSASLVKPFKVSKKTISSENFNNKTSWSKVQRTNEPEENNPPLFKSFKKKVEATKPHLQQRYSDDATSSYSNNKEKDRTSFENHSSLISHEKAKNKVEFALKHFQTFVRTSTLSGDAIPIEASKILKRRGKFVHDEKKIIGDVPGIEVGDEFQYFEVLNVVGLHRNIFNGIDHVRHKGELIATSIVSCRLYDDKLDDAKLVISTGEQGNVINNQNQLKENLALINSYYAKNPVRVIIKLNSKNGSGRLNGGEKYCYYGLYKIDRIDPEIGKSGYKLLLVKSPDQKKVVCSELRKYKQIVKREKCLEFAEDVSMGKEYLPIPMINCVDSESVPNFRYITRMVNRCKSKMVNPLEGNVGCECVGNCSDSDKCSCAVKNGGKFPFNRNGTIEATKKDVVYECGPYCKCSSKCRNRVSQNGIKFPLEIFKTEAKGWGVRSEKKIPSGSFICEYLGEIIEDKKALKMIDNDEYLFNIGNTNHMDGLFTIDASKYGNVARFINHSCSPNLFCQNILFDHDDVRMPHIMLFAAEDIPRKTELTYNYNYKIGQVVDKGVVKKKYCYCGASECVGRLY
ncbi:histone-lysine N-methyltransferase, H3 lysine-9 specific SUVH5-like [Vicia villosa]|uniref:histone-lysine N-methyltransferase, H3 lysine-9 specific SUVH5-like n=1 Tax=Vicia villosa TaxID=3911 RepID=UPI00273AD7CC|nr:histone-lysine N-methyltransferase, H3 lysine-9 specific SUVH5-like [Vicia villosa]